MIRLMEIRNIEAAFPVCVPDWEPDVLMELPPGVADTWKLFAPTTFDT